jgi:FtsZ-binding cell division protein ZapB
MDWKLFEVLEEKIQKTLDQIQSLSRENQELRQKVNEQERFVAQTRERLDGFEEEKIVIQNKVDDLLKKISQIID